jgi:hypothetical protein
MGYGPMYLDRENEIFFRIIFPVSDPTFRRETIEAAVNLYRIKSLIRVPF